MEIPRSLMVQWVEQIAWLLKPLYEVMWRAMKAGGYVQVDETPVKVLDPEVQGKAAQGYLWFFSVPGGDVILEFSRSRGQEVPRRRLQGFEGTIQTAAYQVSGAKEGLNPAAPGMSSALSPSLLSSATRIVSGSAVVYSPDSEAVPCRGPDTLTLSCESLPSPSVGSPAPLWECLKQRAEELQPKLLPQSTMGKAVNYFLNEYSALQIYLKDGRFEIDNNLVENDVRPAAVGRKRWLFIGHPQAGWRSAVVYSVLHSARRRGLNPQSYLTDILTWLPVIKITEINQLLPGQWKSSSVNTS
jgi:transposase